MPTLSELVRSRTELTDVDIEQLHRLLESWQLIADLSFADLLLWAPLGAGDGFVCVAQMRPHTAQTLHPEDRFGEVMRPEELPVIDRAFSEGTRWKQDEPLLIDGMQVRMEAIPVPFNGQVIAVMTKEGAPLFHRRPGRLEEVYLECSEHLGEMVEKGLFPFSGEGFDPEASPRVGDGLMRTDAQGQVVYASPNAISAYRRLGVTSVDELSFEAKSQPSTWEEATGDRIVVHQSIPLMGHGGMVLVRDVTELRHREQMLQHKDAHIREIHHRVKNNLQTIASLLRIQSRRLTSRGAKKELEEAVRRISSIALVHETLTRGSGETVELGGIVRELAEMVSGALIHPAKKIRISVEGEAGRLPAELATPLAVALVELLQNAVEHAFDSKGRVQVSISREGDEIGLVVHDDGRGLPEGFTSDDGGLGLQIVRALVTEQLGGTMKLTSDGGTRVELRFAAKSRELNRPS